MFQALFNSLSGLFSFSRALDTVSNNVANMNTPGFRGSDTFFENIGGEFGTRIAGQGVRTTPGSLSHTGTPTDLAITGNGYFVLQDASGNLYYTRAGQFRFNDKGLLTDSATGYDVMSVDGSGNLLPIDLTSYRTLPGQQTTKVSLTGNIQPGATPPNGSGPYQPSPDVIVPDVQIFDASGGPHALKITVSDNFIASGVQGSFLVTVMDGSTQVGTGTIGFDGLGAMIPGSNTVALNLTYKGTPQAVTLSFGSGYTGSTTSLGGASSVAGQAVDGRAPLGISTLSFDVNGVLQLQYSSSATKQGPQVALASFSSDDALQMIGGRLVAGSSVQQHVFGHPGAGVFGTITGGSLELSNVDLTQEFAQMIIIQRGYQASSKVMTVSNQMIEQLYSGQSGG